MRLVDFQEWQVIQTIQPHLIEAVQRKIEEGGITVQYEFLRHELQKLVISAPTSQDIDQEAIYHFTREINELLDIVYPVLPRLLPDASLLHIQSLLSLPALAAQTEMGDTEANSNSLVGVLLSDVKPILSAFTLFNKHIESIFGNCLLEATPEPKTPKLSGIILNENKRALIDALLISVEQHFACCKRRDQHHMLLQGAGQSWHAEMNSLISLLLSSCRDPIGWQEIECLFDDWSADTISLLLSATTSSSSLEFEIPPYIRCGPKCDPSKKNDDLGIVMNDSVFLALGKLLVEMELGKRIIPTECNRRGQPSLWLTLNKIISEDEMFSACEDYLKAVEGCLELHRSIVELSPEERAAESAKLIYDAIVVNLERDFQHYRKPNRKRKRNVTQTVVSPALNTSTSADVSVVQVTKSRNEEVDARHAGGFGDTPAATPGYSKECDNKICPSTQSEAIVVTEDQKFEQTPKRARVGLQRPFSKSTTVAGSSIRADSSRTAIFSSASSTYIQVFDDLEPDTAATDARTVSLSRNFLGKMQSFLYSYLPESHMENRERLSKRVKVCIIDTGFDERHPALKGAKLMGRIVATKNFKGDPRDLNDEIGHGTHIAELIQTLAPEAELCIAKVAVANAMPQEDTKLIIEAIHWAVAQNADIISLSLGLDKLDLALDFAINKAIAAGKIVVAAAGNDGNNKPRAYPGSNRNVLCIHASNGKGKDGGISPRASDSDDNFMTLGTAIPLIWKGKEVVKFGTSFATAVAAAIAADALEIIPQVVSLNPEQQSRLYSSSGMRSIFDLLSVSDNGYKYVAPWNLWNEHKSNTYIQERISDALKR
ncbi:hypothetical protein GGI43DRAFT_429027 [Trichoderma evansii]